MWWVVNATPRPLYPWERSSTHCTGGWVGLGAGLDRCGNSRLHRDSILYKAVKLERGGED
jgi:hypothetical protein